jgi:hypothetical protein
MRNRLIAFALLVAALLPSPEARTQQAGDAEPIVRATLNPPRVVVGQQTTLHIEVLAPNYMTAPPELPDFQVRNAITRQSQSVNTSEQRDGITYAGVRFEYAIYPQEPGSYAIADQNVRIRYAADPPATRETVIALPRISFEAFVPDAAADLRPFLAASTLTVEQTVKRSSEPLKAGDAVTRTVTIKAEGIPAMLLPPVTFLAIDGLAVYPAQPSLQDKTDARTGTLSATRVDSATYMLERPGDYELPAFDVRWWNVAQKDVEVAHADDVKLQVAENPVARTGAPISGDSSHWSWDAFVDFVSAHWLVMMLAAIVLAGLAWFAPRALRWTTNQYRRSRQAYRQSEAFAFSRLRRAVRGRNARTAYFALLDWLPHVEATAPDHTVEALRAIARDPALDRQLGAMENELFAPAPDADRWSPHQLLRRVDALRRRMRRRTIRREDTPLPRRLNPVGAVAAAPAYGWRKPAR